MQSETEVRSDPARGFIQFRDWTGDRSISTVGTNAGARSLPFQTWRPFKEAFAPEIVERALSDSVGTVRHIADPFGGSGTTALAAQFLGVKPTTIEVNPFLADLIEAKICPLDFDLAADAFGQVVECVARGCEPKRPVFPGASPTFVEPGRDGRYIFSRAVACRLLAYRSAIELVRDEACQRLFRVVLGSTAIPASNVVVSGKGRRYRRRWRDRESPPQVVDELFRDGVLRALHDLRRFAARRCVDYRVLRGDARRLAEEIGPHDLAVFSPPYPNSFDYTDVYNVELWAMGYLRSAEANRELRHATLRSHVQLFRSFDGDGVRSATLTATIDALREVRDELWNPHIPEMITGIRATWRSCWPGSRKGCGRAAACTRWLVTAAMPALTSLLRRFSPRLRSPWAITLSRSSRVVRCVPRRSRGGSMSWARPLSSWRGFSCSHHGSQPFVRPGHSRRQATREFPGAV